MKRKFNINNPKLTDIKCYTIFEGSQGNKIIYDDMTQLAKGYLTREGTEYDETYDEVAVYSLDRIFLSYVWDWLESNECANIRGDLKYKKWSYNHKKTNGWEYTTTITAHFEKGEFVGFTEDEVEHIDIISQ